MDQDNLIEELVTDDTTVTVLRNNRGDNNCSQELLTTGVMCWDNYPVLSVGDMSFNLYSDIFSIALVEHNEVRITLFAERF